MKKINRTTRILLIVCAAALLSVLYFPIWRIELNAPQYPEGLVLLIHANGLRGNVDIINGLNHYIGMHTLHSKDFIEFTLLPYIISFYALLFIIVALVGKRTILYTGFALFVLFGIVAMVDFWKWEYNYGHNLNPNAAIVVPGMAYQPPLIGFKQLLNFGAYSIPDTGGWLFLGVGFLLLVAVVFETTKKKSRSFKTRPAVMAAIIPLLLFTTSCQRTAEPLRLGVDACYSCKMTITDARYGAELITNKGKLYKFDDIHCLQEFIDSKYLPKSDIKEIYLADFSGNHSLVKAGESFLLQSESFRAPMNGNVIAFRNKDSMIKMTQTVKAQEINWENIVK